MWNNVKYGFQVGMGVTLGMLAVKAMHFVLCSTLVEFGVLEPIEKDNA